MAEREREAFEPRKTPVQARSTASVDATLEATIQVLLEVGKERLTTTRVAMRAGVSVGTLYQYFPNKSSLLQAALKRHLDAVTEAVEAVCQAKAGTPLAEMATALISVFFAAKMKDAKTSVALYAVSGDVDGARISREMGERSNRAISGMLRTAREGLRTDPEVAATILQGAMVGVSRRMLEAGVPAKEEMESLRRELISMACAYLEASSRRVPEEVLVGAPAT